MNNKPGRPASQPDLRTLLLGGTHQAGDECNEYIGYTNMIPLSDDKLDIEKMLKKEQDRDHFAKVIRRIAEKENTKMVEANFERAADAQFVPYSKDEVDAALDELYAAFKKNVEAYWEHRPDLRVKHVQAINAPVSRGALIRSRSAQVALADDKPSSQSN